MIRRLLAVAFVACAVPVSAHATGATITPLERAFVNAINGTRVEHGVPRVELGSALVRAARFHSSDMVEHGYFAHGDFSDRLGSFGVGYGRVGEILGWDARVHIAVPQLIAMWLASPEHRVVLLDPIYRRVGVGTSEGAFEGNPEAVVVTADFYGP